MLPSMETPDKLQATDCRSSKLNVWELIKVCWSVVVVVVVVVVVIAAGGELLWIVVLRTHTTLQLDILTNLRLTDLL